MFSLMFNGLNSTEAPKVAVRTNLSEALPWSTLDTSPGPVAVLSDENQSPAQAPLTWGFSKPRHLL